MIVYIYFVRNYLVVVPSARFWQRFLKYNKMQKKEINFNPMRCVYKTSKISSCTNKELRKVLWYMEDKIKKLKQRTETNMTKKKLFTVFDQVIPNEYVGSTSNRKQLYYVIKLMLNFTFGQRIHPTDLSREWENVMKWSEPFTSRSNFEFNLQNMNNYVLERVIKPIIRHYFKIVRTYKSYEVLFIPKNEWMSFRAQAYRELLLNGKISECSEEDKLQVTSRGLLKLIPKNSSLDNKDGPVQFRAIVCLYNNNANQEQKYTLKGIARNINKYILDNSHYSDRKKDLYLSWLDYTSKHRDQALYGFKADIQDAFGSVDIEKLSQYIREYLGKILTPREMELVLHRISNQYVTTSNKTKSVVRWNRGLLQGDRLSSCLCDLYTVFQDQKYLEKHLDDTCFIHRTVDDYFICATTMLKMKSCFSELSKMHNLKQEKTQLLMSSQGIKEQEKVSYCGFLFDLATTEVKIHYNFKPRESVRHKFNFWGRNTAALYAVNNPNEILIRSLKFASINHYFNKITLSTNFNSEESVLKNYFESMLYLAYKFDAAFGYVHRKSLSGVDKLVKNKILEFSRRSLKIIKKTKGYHFTGGINLKMLIRVGTRAFSLVLKRRKAVYENLLPGLFERSCICLEDLQINKMFFDKLPDGFKDIRVNNAM